MNTLSIHLPGRTIHMRGEIGQHNVHEVGEALNRQLPVLAETYGRVSAVYTKDGIAHIIASMKGTACRS